MGWGGADGFGGCECTRGAAGARLKRRESLFGALIVAS